jgi:phosphonate transport system substrate-binding protein
MNDLAVFGYVGRGVSDATRGRFVQFTERLGRLVDMEIAVFEATSYDDLSKAVVSCYVDLAWLPPIPFMALEQRSAVRPLVSHERAGDFHSALIVPEGSRCHALADLEGARAAWVDRESASGFVLARIALAEAHVDLRRAFSEERFFGSHEAVARAIARGVADFGATYAGVDAKGALTRAPWLSFDSAESQRIRVLARVGGIPSDTTVSRASLPEATRDKITDALVKMSQSDKHRSLLVRLFGIERFARWKSAGYAELREKVDAASAAGLFAM